MTIPKSLDFPYDMTFRDYSETTQACSRYDELLFNDRNEFVRGDGNNYFGSTVRNDIRLE